MLLVDAGGLCGPRTKLDKEQTRFLCQETHEFGYDAIGLGQADLNYGLGFLREMIATYKLPFTNANVHDPATGQLLLPESLVVERGGVRFGICSVLDPSEKFITMGAQDENFTVDDPTATLRVLVPKLREKAQTIVLLSHLDVPKTEALVKEVAGIDIAVVGHTHQTFDGERVVGKTLLLAAGYEGRVFGRLDAQIDAGGAVKAFENKIVPLDEKIADDPVMLEKVNGFKKKLEEMRLSLRGTHLPVKGSASEQFLSEYECRKCHEKIFTALQGSAHEGSLASLAKRGMAQEADCLVCHVTGYEYQNGFDDRPPNNRLGNVQCEACHGYGSLHRRDGHWAAEARASCAGCHDKKNSPNFDFATYWDKIKH